MKGIIDSSQKYYLQKVLSKFGIDKSDKAVATWFALLLS